MSHGDPNHLQRRSGPPGPVHGRGRIVARARHHPQAKREDVALIAASELESLLETAHLLRSPRNAERLLTALARARAGDEPPATVEELRRELGLADD